MIAASGGAGLAVLVAVLVAAEVTGDKTSTFTRDPAVLAPDMPLYAGSVSILNAVAWGSVASLSLFVAATGATAVRRPLRLFGVLALMLLADDALTIHEAIGPRVGLPDEIFYLVYAGVALAVVWTMRAHLRTGAGAALLLGGACLVLSTLVDQLLGTSAFPQSALLEDGAKLLGAFFWVTVPVLAYDGSHPGPRGT